MGAADHEWNAAVSLDVSLHQIALGILQISAAPHLHHLQFDIQASSAVPAAMDAMGFFTNDGFES